jgi:hypothetical protein
VQCNLVRGSWNCDLPTVNVELLKIGEGQTGQGRGLHDAMVVQSRFSIYTTNQCAPCWPIRTWEKDTSHLKNLTRFVAHKGRLKLWCVVYM